MTWMVIYMYTQPTLKPRTSSVAAALIPVGSGNVVLLGYDWYQARLVYSSWVWRSSIDATIWD